MRKATECLAKDRDSLLTFYDFPAEHWLHIRTTNPIESTFATVRLRTSKTRGCVSRAGILAMVFKLRLRESPPECSLVHNICKKLGTDPVNYIDPSGLAETTEYHLNTVKPD